VTRTPALPRVLNGFALVTAAVCIYGMRQADPDFFGYLAYGRLFLRPGGLDEADPFAYTSHGLSWISFEYAAQIIFWLTYSNFGPIGLIALKCIVGAGVLLFVRAAVRLTTDDPYVWAPAFLLVTLTLVRYFLFRPQLFTFLFFAIFVAITFRFVIQGRAALWCLPPLTLIWANLHGGFVAGLGVLALAICGTTWSLMNDGAKALRSAAAAIRPLVITLVCCLLASLINPQGVRLWSYISRELLHDTNRRYIEEWMPVSLQRDVWSAVALTVMTATLIALGWMTTRQRLRVAGLYGWQWVTLSLPIVAIAYMTVRNVPIAAIWLGPVIAVLASELNKSKSRGGFADLWTGVGTCVLVGVVLTFTYVWNQPRPEIATGGTVLGSRNPCRAVEFMRRNGVKGNVYNPLWWGSYISWELYPAVRVSMDGRNVSLFPDEMVMENFGFYSSDPRRIKRDAPLQYDTDLLLIPSDSKVLQAIETDRRWRRLYNDEDAALFERADRSRGRFPLASYLTLGVCSPILGSERLQVVADSR
jgi:hypothetical protein